MEKLANVQKNVLPSLWRVLLNMMPDHEQVLLHILLPLDNEDLVIQRVNILARCRDTWARPGLMDALERHIDGLGSAAVQYARGAAQTAALHSAIKDSGAEGALAQDVLDRLWAPPGLEQLQPRENPVVRWTVLLRMLADQTEVVGHPEDLDGVTARADVVLARLLSHGLDLERGGSMQVNGQDVPYQSALDAACQVLEDTKAGKTAVALLINHGADVDRVLALDIGATARETIENHPRLVARRLNAVAKETGPARRKRAMRHI